MAINKKANTSSQSDGGKGSLREAKTNEDFNKRKPLRDDPELKIKTVKK